MQEFLKEANWDRRKLASLREYLNHLENVAVSVNQRVLDLKTISMSEGGRIIDTVTNYGPYVVKVREEVGTPLLYSELELLARKIQEFRHVQEDLEAGPREIAEITAVAG